MAFAEVRIPARVSPSVYARRLSSNVSGVSADRGGQSRRVPRPPRPAPGSAPGAGRPGRRGAGSDRGGHVARAGRDRARGRHAEPPERRPSRPDAPLAWTPLPGAPRRCRRARCRRDPARRVARPLQSLQPARGRPRGRLRRDRARRWGAARRGPPTRAPPAYQPRRRRSDLPADRRLASGLRGGRERLRDGRRPRYVRGTTRSVLADHATALDPRGPGSLCLHLPAYGTRSSTVLVVPRAAGPFHYFHADGPPCRTALARIGVPF